MVFGFQVVCLLVTLVTVFAYIAHHVYSREHRLLPLFLGVIAVFDFYRIVLMLTGAVGLFAQLENLLILTLSYFVGKAEDIYLLLHRRKQIKYSQKDWWRLAWLYVSNRLGLAWLKFKLL